MAPGTRRDAHAGTLERHPIPAPRTGAKALEAVSKRLRYDVNGGGWPEAIVIPRGHNTCHGISDVDFDHPAAA